LILECTELFDSLKQCQKLIFNKKIEKKYKTSGP